MSGESVAIGTVADLIKRGISPKYSTDGMRVVNQKCIRDFRVNYDLARRHDGQQKPVKPELHVRQFDVLVNSTGVGTLGRVAFVDEAPEEPTAVDSHVTLIRPDLSRVDGAYFGYCICALQSVIEGMGVGATGQTELSRIRLSEDLFLRLPPIEDQRLIGQILWRFDQALENNARRIEILEEMAHAIYREWFVEFRYPGHEDAALVDSELGPIPESWEWRQIREISSECRTSVDPTGLNSDVPYFGLEHLPQRSIALSDWGRASEAGSRKYQFEVGDILFGKIRPYFHKVGVPPVAGICSTDAIVVRPNQGFSGFCLATVSSDAFVAQAVQTSQGTKMPRANWAVLETYPIAVPSGVLLGMFESYMADTVQLIQTLVMTNRILRETRDLLLPRLISGEIDVSELDIELSGSSV